LSYLLNPLVNYLEGIVNSYNKTQGSAANRPTYLYPAITAPNGIVYGAARFDGLNDFLTWFIQIKHKIEKMIHLKI
jgi:hypothetical protein